MGAAEMRTAELRIRSRPETAPDGLKQPIGCTMAPAIAPLFGSEDRVRLASSVMDAILPVRHSSPYDGCFQIY